MKIYNYDSFVKALLDCGFSMGGGSDNGIFTLINWGWNETPPEDTPIKWHTGDIETDPWEWHTRVVAERNDIACAKLFFNKVGYITKEYYPYFLKVRRDGADFDGDYEAGKMSVWEKRIYECVRDNGRIAYHDIKTATGFNKEEKSKFERAVMTLQMKMYITSCGTKQKVSKMGEPFGWPSVLFCTTEEFIGQDVFERSEQITYDEAVEKITNQVLKLNPSSGENPKNILKFIKG